MSAQKDYAIYTKGRLAITQCNIPPDGRRLTLSQPFCSYNLILQIICWRLFFQKNVPSYGISVKHMNKINKLSQSKNYRRGSFQNISPTPMKPDDISYFQMIKGMMNRPKNVRPHNTIPSIKTDLSAFQSEFPIVIWFGHSSYLIHFKGKNILVDPVFSKHASPLPFMIKAFKGTNEYTAEKMPWIDLLILTHNHYDHLDIETIKRLKEKTKSYLTTLGVGKTLKSCGINEKLITELDWWESKQFSEKFKITATPARHFSGRGIKRGGSLWASFVLELEDYKVFIGGDSGYDTHFKLIGDQFGPFNLAILECGQYNTAWPLIHMMPEETVQASLDLKANVLLPVHWGKFALAYHPWNEPINRVVKAAKDKGVTITHPLIGEPVIIGKSYPKNEWWNFQ